MKNKTYIKPVTTLIAVQGDSLLQGSIGQQPKARHESYSVDTEQSQQISNSNKITWDDDWQ